MHKQVWLNFIWKRAASLRVSRLTLTGMCSEANILQINRCFNKSVWSLTFVGLHSLKIASEWLSSNSSVPSGHSSFTVTSDYRTWRKSTVCLSEGRARCSAGGSNLAALKRPVSHYCSNWGGDTQVRGSVNSSIRDIKLLGNKKRWLNVTLGKKKT